MSVSSLFAKVRRVLRLRQASVRPPLNRNFQAMVFLNGRCLADASMGFGLDAMFEPERQAAMATMGLCSGY
jgi:hypothetical protein